MDIDDTFIRIKYWPMSADDTYISQLPAEVVSSFANSFEIENKNLLPKEKAKLLIQISNFDFIKKDPEVSDVIWEALKAELLKYHGQK